MKISDMKTGVPYIALLSSDCGTIQMYDQLMVDNDGSLVCTQAGGWLEKDNWKDDPLITELPVIVNEKLIRKKIDRYTKILENSVDQE